MLLAKAKISDHVFFGNLPAVLESEWTEMILVDVLKVTDYGAYAKCTANVFLYAKATDNLSRKPIKKLNSMEVALDKAIEANYDKNYSVEISWRDNDYNEDTDFYYNVVNINVTQRKMYNQ